MTFTKDQLATWLTALRSGKYRQGRLQLTREVDNLTDEYLYCCLGVCGEVVYKYHKVEMRNFGTLSSLISVKVETIPFTTLEEETLVRLNDHYELTFPQIAAFVECYAFDFYTFYSTEAKHELGMA